MTRRISASILLVTLAALLFCSFFMLQRQCAGARELLRQSLTEEAAAIAAGTAASGDDYLRSLPASERCIRRLDASGSEILAVNEAPSSHNTVHAAALLPDGGRIEIFCAAPGMLSLVADMLLPAALTAAGLLVFALVLSSLLSKKIVEPINAIDPEKLENVPKYPELAPLIHKIGRQNELITKQMNDLRRHQEEFRAITENMDEGFVLVDRKTDILSYNASAVRLLGGGSTDGGIQRSPAFRAVVGEALTGRHNERTVTIDGRVCQLIANPVTGSEKTDGAVVIALDVTERRQREQMRREFTSNVSHELKTPLTSIYGISDIIMNGLVKPEDITKFASDIHRESGRLISLVEDTIKLSQLDEDSIPYEREQVDLYAAASEVVARLRPEALRQEIAVRLEGESHTVNGIRSILTEILMNLCDNAIKYNRPGGSVTVNITSEGGRPMIIVSDTGIGIPKEHVDRVFERFYRVDKSHSKAIGGTGLGLSIVKHGAAYHGADVKLESEAGVGTTVTIRFPA